MTDEVRLFISTTANRSVGSKLLLIYRLATSGLKAGSGFFIDHLQIVAINCGIVAADGKDLRHLSSSAPPLDVYEKIERLRDVAANCSIRKVNAGHQHTGRKAGDGLSGRVGVQCGERP